MDPKKWTDLQNVDYILEIFIIVILIVAVTIIWRAVNCMWMPW